MAHPRAGKGIRAEVTKRSPRIKWFYYVLDMATYDVRLYQTLPLVLKSFQTGIWGLKRDIYYQYLHRDIKEKKAVMLSNRFLIGRTTGVFLKALKRDSESIAAMNVDYPTPQSNPNLLL